MKEVFQKIEKKLELLNEKTIIILILISIVSILIRIHFTRFEYLFESQDAFIYLLQAISISNGEHWTSSSFPVTYGWQAMLSFFFGILQPEEYIEAMNIQRISSIIVSAATIPIIYLIGKKFLEKKYALLAASFFAFDPNLIENSIFGISESLFIFLGVVSLYCFLQQQTRYFLIGAIIAGFSFDVRLSGGIFFVMGIIISLTNSSSKSYKIKNVSIVILFFIISTSPVFFQSMMNEGNPLSFVQQTTEGVVNNPAPSLSADALSGGFSNQVKIGLTEEFKHIFRISIPYLALFVPFGLIALFSNINFEKKIIFLTVIVTLIIAIPQYWLSLEYRNIFFILPMFSLIGAMGIQRILTNQQEKNLFLILIVAGIILLSYNMMRERNDIDLIIVDEKERFGQIVTNSMQGSFMGDMYTYVSHNLQNAKISPLGGGHLGNDGIILHGFGPPQISMKDTIEWAKKHNVTHLIIDDQYDERSPELIDVYFEETKYPYLEKTFDSSEENFKKLRVKIFEINYSKLE
jgi:hypothetical protein